MAMTDESFVDQDLCGQMFLTDVKVIFDCIQFTIALCVFVYFS